MPPLSIISPSRRQVCEQRSRRYTDDVIRCAITDGSGFGDTAAARRAGLLADAVRWSELGVDFVQLREKTLAAGELMQLATAMMAVFRKSGGTTKLLVNGRADIALAAEADGVHLTSAPDELTPKQVRQLFARAGRRAPVVGVSCHSVAEVERARNAGVDFILFGPVFEKRIGGSLVREGVGLEALRRATAAGTATPVLALGGVDERNAALCVDVGAAGIAGIRLFS
jgi:thiamine-phosphate pyrophosphorylase